MTNLKYFIKKAIFNYFKDEIMGLVTNGDYPKVLTVKSRIEPIKVSSEYVFRYELENRDFIKDMAFDVCMRDLGLELKKYVESKVDYKERENQQEGVIEVSIYVIPCSRLTNNQNGKN